MLAACRVILLSLRAGPGGAGSAIRHPEPSPHAGLQADVLIKTPLTFAEPFCKLLASVVRNDCRSVVEALDDEPFDDPSAVKRFWKSVDKELSLDDVPVVLASVDALSRSEPELDVEDDLSDCARLAIADARSPP
jgi:hypothetical protein